LRKKLGIVGLYEHADEKTGGILEDIEGASDLKIMAVSAHSAIPLYKDAIVTAMVKGNCCVKVLIARAKSRFVKDIERIEGPGRNGQISAEIDETKSMLEDIARKAHGQSRARSRKTGRIWIETYSTEFRGSLVICNNSRVWYTPGLPPRKAVESLSFELKLAEGGLLDNCVRHFDAVWARHISQAEEIDP